ncbi:MAG: BON domain-containing protein [Actinomycetota bacterium]|nr:BON domain-containing protein [Actinomycetota bacterium]
MISYFAFDFFPDRFFHPPVYFHPGPPPAADEQLALRVADRLRDELSGPADRVLVEVQNRVVILEGAVGTSTLRTRVHRLVWLTPGVADVCNRLDARDDEPPRAVGGWSALEDR